MLGFESSVVLAGRQAMSCFNSHHDLSFSRAQWRGVVDYKWFLQTGSHQ
jgi:hypothetical protein